MFGFHRIYLVPIKTAELCSELQLAPGAHQLLDFESSTTGLNVTETTCSRPAYEITRGMDDASAPCGDEWTEKLTNGCLKVRWIQCTWICEPPLHSSTGPGFKHINFQQWEKMVNVQSRETKSNTSFTTRIRGREWPCVLSQLHLIHGWKLEWCSTNGLR